MHNFLQIATPCVVWTLSSYFFPKRSLCLSILSCLLLLYLTAVWVGVSAPYWYVPRWQCNYIMFYAPHEEPRYEFPMNTLLFLVYRHLSYFTPHSRRYAPVSPCLANVSDRGRTVSPGAFDPSDDIMGGDSFALPHAQSSSPLLYVIHLCMCLYPLWLCVYGWIYDGWCVYIRAWTVSYRVVQKFVDFSLSTTWSYFKCLERRIRFLQWTLGFFYQKCALVKRTLDKVKGRWRSRFRALDTFRWLS